MPPATSLEMLLRITLSDLYSVSAAFRLQSGHLQGHSRGDFIGAGVLVDGEEVAGSP